MNYSEWAEQQGASERYIKREMARARRDRQPIYRFGTDRYECPFCRFRAKREDTVFSHLETYHLEA